VQEKKRLVMRHSLAEDVKLSAHGRHPTTYPFYFFVCLFILFLLLFLFLFLFSFVTLVFCFLGTSVLEFKFGEIWEIWDDLEDVVKFNQIKEIIKSEFLKLESKSDWI
jgi:hypothetical protein